MTQPMTFHPACLLFPQLPDEELGALAEDIRTNGLLNSIIKLKDQILDGRNRYLACGLAGIEPRFEEWNGEGSPTEWVISQNLFRRHLTSSQRAVVAVGLLPLLEAEAKERQRLSQGRGKKGAKDQATFSANGKASQVAARIANTNAAYVEAVKTIQRQAPELVEEIRSGALTVPDAAKLAPLRKQQRSKALVLLKNSDRKRNPSSVARQVQLEAATAVVPDGKRKGAGGRQEIWCGDCVKLMAEKFQPGSVSVVITSVPYNVGVKYDNYHDDRPEEEYLAWLGEVFQAIKRALRDDGSFFLNIGSTRKKPWTAMKVAQVAGQFFVLQNEIVWAKAVTVEGQSYGHFSPLKGSRYLNHNFEQIFHFTKNGDVKLDRLAVGVPYQDRNNLLRNQAEGDLRCGGDVWFIGHETIHDKGDKGDHPCVFPVELPERCIRLHGIRKDMLVLDPFCGSGSSLIAAKRLGVAGVGMDISAVYCDEAKRRLARQA